MNLLLHGIGGDSDAPVPILVKDALAAKHGEYELILTNPPFGKKSSVTIVNEAGDEEKQSLIVHRDDFWATTSNKQLTFSSTSLPFSSNMDVPPLLSRTTSFSKVVLGKQFGANC